MANTINNRVFSKGESQWSFFLPIAFVLVQYGYGLNNLMLTYCTLFAGYYVLKYGKFDIYKPLSVYTLWYVFILICTVVVFGHSANRAYLMKLLQILVCGYSVTIIAKHLDKESMYRCWKVLGLIVCGVVAYQFSLIFVLHQSVRPIPLLPLSSGDLLRNPNWIISGNRPVAFFTEPAMVVAFLTPVLLLAQQKKELIVSVIVSIAILLTGSTSGVIALAIIWGVSLFSNRTSRVYRIFLIVLIASAVFGFLYLPYFSDSLAKIDYELSGESANMDARMLRGWWIYDTLDLRSKLLGLSDHDIVSYVLGNSYGLEWLTGSEEFIYLNTAQRILIQTGVVGAVIYIWMLTKIWMSTDKAVKPYLVVVIVSMFFASNFYISGLFVMQFILLLSYLEKIDPKSKLKKHHYAQESNQKNTIIRKRFLSKVR